MNLDEIFGEVRSLLGRREHDKTWGEHLLGLALRAKKEAPEFHAEVLLPYIEGQRVDWPEPLLAATLDTIDSFRDALPMATFSLDLRDTLLVGEPEPEYLPYNNGSSLRVLPNNGLLANVSKLRLDSRLTLPAALKALLHDPKATALRDLEIQNHDLHPRTIRFLSEEALDAICTAPSASSWHHLAIRGSSLTSALTEPFLANFPGDSLKTLDISNNYIRQTSPVSSPPWFGQLEKINVSSCNLHPEEIARLLSARVFTNLEKLSLSGNDASGEGIGALAGKDRFPALRELELGNCQLGPDEITRLLELDLPSLTRLSIIRNELDRDTLAAFITSPFTRKLKGFELSLTSNDVQAFRPLLTHPNIEVFETLTLGIGSPFRIRTRASTPLADDAAQKQREDADLIQQIITSIAPENMRILVLVGAPVNETTAHHIARMENLEHLDLHNAIMTPDALRALFSTSFPNLAFANFRSLGLDDATLDAFLDGAVMANLSHLVLSANQLSDRGATQIAAMKKTPKLRKLSLSDNDIGDTGCVAFIESKPFRDALENFDILNNPFDNNTGHRVEHELRPHMDVTCFMRIG